MTTPAWISLGSNLGDRRAILDEAVARLGQTPGVVVAQVSSYRETRPVGGPPGQGPFLNAAARLDTTLTPRELLGTLQAIERDLGRVRTVRWGERTLDLDILIYGCKFIDEPDLKLPHPRLAVRRFVLEPLAEIASEVTDTITRRTIADLVNNLDRIPRLLLIDGMTSGAAPAIARRVAIALSGISIHLADVAPVPALSLDQLARIDGERRSILCELDLITAAIRRFDHADIRWVVADFWLDIASLKKIVQQSPLPLLYDRSRRDESRWKLPLRQRLRITPNPVAILAGPDSRFKWRPNLYADPVYWPEATEPDAIVAEVIAVCRGIEGI